MSKQMEKIYTASLTSRFGGMYYSVRYLDFDDLRGRDLEPEDLKNIKLLEADLQSIIDKMVAEGRPIPEPKLTEYENREYSGTISSAGYTQVKVLVPK